MTTLFSRTLNDGRTLTCTMTNGEPVFDIDGDVKRPQSMVGICTIDDLREDPRAGEVVRAMEEKGAKVIWNYQICLYGDEPAMIEEAREAYYNRPEVRLPREREELVYAISAACDAWEVACERDYAEDTGLHESHKAEHAVRDAEAKLRDFDAVHPEVAAKIAEEKKAETARQIQSALNA